MIDCDNIIYDAIMSVEDGLPSYIKRDKNSTAEIIKLEDVISDFCEEFDGRSVNVIVNSDYTLSIRIDCVDVYTEEDENPFIDLADVAISFKLSSNRIGGMVAEFIIPGVWYAEVNK